MDKPAVKPVGWQNIGTYKVGALKSLFYHSWQIIWKCFWIPSFCRSLHSNRIQQPYSHSHLWPRKCLPFLLGTNSYTYMTHYYLKILQDTTWKQHLNQAVQTQCTSDFSLLTHVVTWTLWTAKADTSQENILILGELHDCFPRQPWSLICEISSASEL